MMGDLLAFGAKKLFLGLGGLALALGWMTISGGGDGDYQTVDKLPAAVFEGGGGVIMLEVETNQPAVLKASFSQWDEEGDSESDLYVEQNVHPGPFVRTVDVSPDTYVYFEIGVPDATVGATLSWRVSIDGEEVWREEDRLAEPLEDGYAFFVQFEADDVDQIREWVE